jgi:hypothetical protein
MSGALKTRDTVAGDTPAWLDTSRIVMDGGRESRSDLKSISAYAETMTAA